MPLGEVSTLHVPHLMKSLLVVLDSLLHVNQTKEDYSIKAEIHAELEPERTLREEDSKAEILAECDVLEKTKADQRRLKEESKVEIHLDVMETRLFTKLDCICIQLGEAGDDEWTKLMIRFRRSKHQVSREVRVLASDAMEKYIDGMGEYEIIEERYSHRSLVVPRLIEVTVNIVLTGWLRVYGLSSSLIAMLWKSQDCWILFHVLLTLPIALNLKNAKRESFNDIRPILLCNLIYRIVTKVILNKIKPKMAEFV